MGHRCIRKSNTRRYCITCVPRKPAKRRTLTWRNGLTREYPLPHVLHHPAKAGGLRGAYRRLAGPEHSIRKGFPPKTFSDCESPFRRSCSSTVAYDPQIELTGHAPLKSLARPAHLMLHGPMTLAFCSEGRRAHCTIDVPGKGADGGCGLWAPRSPWRTMNKPLLPRR